MTAYQQNKKERSQWGSIRELTWLLFHGVTKDYDEGTLSSTTWSDHRRWTKLSASWLATTELESQRRLRAWLVSIPQTTDPLKWMVRDLYNIGLRSKRSVMWQIRQIFLASHSQWILGVIMTSYDMSQRLWSTLGRASLGSLIFQSHALWSDWILSRWCAVFVIAALLSIQISGSWWNWWPGWTRRLLTI